MKLRAFTGRALRRHGSWIIYDRATGEIASVFLGMTADLRENLEAAQARAGTPLAALPKPPGDDLLSAKTHKIVAGRVVPKA